MSAVYNHEFTGRRPSQPQVVKVLKEAVKQGAVLINIDWGENWLRFEYDKSSQRFWGFGWMRSLGGDSLAQQLNRGIL